MRKALNLLKKTPLYRRFEWSPVHRWIIRLRNPDYEAALAQDAVFYRNLIKPGDLVFDVGANYGSKAEVFLKLGARVVLVEPDRRSCRILRQRFVRWQNVTLEERAVAERPGTLVLHCAEPGSAYNTLSEKWRDVSHGNGGDSYPVEVTTLDDLITKHGLPEFLKIDVEGYEREALRGLSSAVRAISFEANLPEFRDETIECLQKLEMLDDSYRFGFYADLASAWQVPSLTMAQACHRVAEYEGYCEIFAVASWSRLK